MKDVRFYHTYLSEAVLGKNKIKFEDFMSEKNKVKKYFKYYSKLDQEVYARSTLQSIKESDIYDFTKQESDKLTKKHLKFLKSNIDYETGKKPTNKEAKQIITQLNIKKGKKFSMTQKSKKRIYNKLKELNFYSGSELYKQTRKIIHDFQMDQNIAEITKLMEKVENSVDVHQVIEEYSKQLFNKKTKGNQSHISEIEDKLKLNQTLTEKIFVLEKKNIKEKKKKQKI